jgi:hypothetical protein
MAGSEDRVAWPKPLDVGNGQVCASFAVDGSWLSLGRPRPGRGFMELTGAPAFDEALRGRPDAVRRHRHQLTLAGNAALRLAGGISEVTPDPGPPGRPRWSGADQAPPGPAGPGPGRCRPGCTSRPGCGRGCRARSTACSATCSAARPWPSPPANGVS